MNYQLKTKHIIVVLILGVMIWKLLPVIDYFTGKTIDWKQEAPLHDGRMLIVERRSKLSPSDPFQLSVRFEIAQKLTFTHPDTGEKISWDIPDGLLPVMIDFDQGIPYFVLLASDYSKWGCPNPPYLVYRYQRGKWKHVEFEALPTVLEDRNLIAQSGSVYSGVRVLPDGSYVPANVMEIYWKEFRSSSQVGQRTRKLSREKENPQRVTSECSIAVLVAMGRESEIDEKTWAEAKKEEERFSREVTPEDQVFLGEKFRKETEARIKELKQRLESTR